MAEEAETKESKPWYAESGWLRATIDLSDFDLGLVHLVDARGDRIEAWRRSHSNDPISIESQAKLFAAYVDHSDNASMPKARCDWPAWAQWIKGSHNKAIVRLYQGILHFSDRMAKVETDTPN